MPPAVCLSAGVIFLFANSSLCLALFFSSILHLLVPLRSQAGQLHHWTPRLRRWSHLLGSTSRKRPKNPSLQNLHKLMGARAAKKDQRETARVRVLPPYVPLSLEVPGEVLGEYKSCWGRTAREEKGCVWRGETPS